jgi:hypothetical protein
MVVGGCRMFFGFAPEWEQALGRPLAEVTDLCGLTLGGGVHEELESSPAGPEARKAARNPHGLRLVVIEEQRVHGRTP